MLLIDFAYSGTEPPPLETGTTPTRMSGTGSSLGRPRRCVHLQHGLVCVLNQCSGEPRTRAMQPTHELPGAGTGAAVLGSRRRPTRPCEAISSLGRTSKGGSCWLGERTTLERARWSLCSRRRIFCGIRRSSLPPRGTDPLSVLNQIDDG